MTWLKTIASEVFGLFVEDGSFAVALLLWIALLWVLIHYVAISGVAAAALLFGGLAVVLVESVLRFARSKR